MKQFLLGAAFGISASIVLLPGMVSAASREDYKALDLIADVIERINANYVHEIAVSDLAEKAIQGMLSALDAHSSYINASDLKALTSRHDSATASTGLTLTVKRGLVRVIAPTEGSPAAKEGIEAGDYLLAIDGENMNDLPLSNVLDKLRGPKDSELRLTIQHELGQKPQIIAIKRALLDAEPDVKYQQKNDIGYICITRFGEETASHLHDAVQNLKTLIGPKLKGYVLDLRNNPGGLLDQGIAVSDALLDKGQIVSLRGRHKEDNVTFSAKSGDVTDGKPIIVLVNQGSAAGSEIVAAALQDNHRAVVLGMPTFGEGTVQTIIPVAEGGALRLTTAEFFSPSGRAIQLNGVTPDMAVSQVAKDDDPVHDFLSESQLSRHLESQTPSAPTAVLEVLYPSTDKKYDDFQLTTALEKLDHS